MILLCIRILLLLIKQINFNTISKKLCLQYKRPRRCEIKHNKTNETLHRHIIIIIRHFV